MNLLHYVFSGLFSRLTSLADLDNHHFLFSLLCNFIFWTIKSNLEILNSYKKNVRKLLEFLTLNDCYFNTDLLLF